MDTTADILRKAKAHISDPAMWHKGSYFKPGTKRKCACALGAVRVALGPDDEWRVGDRSEAVKFLRASLNGRWWLLRQFNDHPDTTHADIMDLFDRAIAAAEAAQ